VRTALALWPVGWVHDRAGVFSGRAQWETAKIQRGSKTPGLHADDDADDFTFVRLLTAVTLPSHA
jgi:hypothetical protein